MLNEKKVFISYSRADSAVVFPLVERLQKAVGDVFWMDLNGIESGDQFVEIIIKAIDNVDVILFMHSTNSLSSEWVKKEILYAQGKKKKIIPILVDGKPLDGWFLFQFGGNDFINPANESHCNKLVRDLKSWFDIETENVAVGKLIEGSGESEKPHSEENIVKDPRDGQIYRTVQIGKQIWLAENLRYRCDGSFAYNNSRKHAEEYGRLYTWTGARRAAIPGWHLPTDKEFIALRKNADAEYFNGGIDVLMARNSSWINAKVTESRDKLGFSALPAGWHCTPDLEDFDDSEEDDDADMVFLDVGQRSYFWSDTESDVEGEYYALEISSSKHYTGYDEERLPKECAVSVRLVKD